MNWSFFIPPDGPADLPGHLASLVARFQIPIISKMEDGKSYFYFDRSGPQEKLLYCSAASALNLKMSLDWVDSWQYLQRQNYSLSREPLAKAVGAKRSRALNIWDLTCGMGHDSFLFLNWGNRVVAFERSPAVCLLLCDAMKRAQESPVPLLAEVLKNKFQLLFQDPRDPLPTTLPAELPQVIYLDPMYGNSWEKRTAKPKKEIQLFQELVGYDPDAPDLLNWALEMKVPRVVVKRHLRALPVIKTPAADASILGKTVRYDLYFNKK
ncbi:MAG: class I SAM-dependent methyltransferase, partial [Pseudomonadota bacterium]